MKLLAIDTSTERASVALINQGIITEKTHSSQRQHAQFLLSMIDELLVDSGVSLSQLDGIVFGRGPGSFTGLRITCSIAKGLAYAQDLPLMPASSLEAIASNALEEQSLPVLAMIDARMNQVYWRYFSSSINNEEEQVSSIQDIKIGNDETFVLAGVGYEDYLDQIPLAIRTKMVSCNPIYPTARAMIQLALKGKLSRVSPQEALPVYIRNQITQGVSNG